MKKRRAAANSTYALLCWQVGRRLLKKNLQTRRAAYGKQILATLSQELTLVFGHAFTLRSLYQASQLCRAFTYREIVSTLSTQLRWTHYRSLLRVGDAAAKRLFEDLAKGGGR